MEHFYIKFRMSNLQFSNKVHKTKVVENLFIKNNYYMNFLLSKVVQLENEKLYKLK